MRLVNDNLPVPWAKHGPPDLPPAPQPTTTNMHSHTHRSSRIPTGKNPRVHRNNYTKMMIASETTMHRLDVDTHLSHKKTLLSFLIWIYKGIFGWSATKTAFWQHSCVFHERFIICQGFCGLFGYMVDIEKEKIVPIWHLDLNSNTQHARCLFTLDRQVNNAETLDRNHLVQCDVQYAIAQKKTQTGTLDQQKQIWQHIDDVKHLNYHQ